jgi:hypothetical protein
MNANRMMWAALALIGAACWMAPAAADERAGRGTRGTMPDNDSPAVVIPQPNDDRERRRGTRRGEQEGGQRYAGVPPGHMPPAGKCRIWLPRTAPGQQPPIGDCNVLSGQVPPGGRLIRRRPD